ncbi:hypothetical protein L208DRAFT_1532013, partial [Tricholoma matsutake]
VASLVDSHILLSFELFQPLQLCVSLPFSKLATQPSPAFTFLPFGVSPPLALCRICNHTPSTVPRLLAHVSL